LTACKAGDPNGNPLTCLTVDGVFKGSNVIQGDINQDGIVDILDMIRLAAMFGRGG